jgi:hypothetical protein
MPNDEHSLLFTTRVDLSGLEKGLAEAKASLNEASEGFEELSVSALDSERAVDAVMEAFAGLSAEIDERIEQDKAYNAAIQETAAAYEQRLIAQRANAVAEVILGEVTKQRTTAEMNANNASRAAYEEGAKRVLFAVKANEDYAASVQAVTTAYREQAAVRATEGVAVLNPAVGGASAGTVDTAATSTANAEAAKAEAAAEDEATAAIQRKAAADQARNVIARGNLEAQRLLAAAFYEARKAGASEVEATEQAVAAWNDGTLAAKASAEAINAATAAKEKNATASTEAAAATDAATQSQNRELIAMTAYEAATRNKKINQEQLGAAYDKAVAAGRSEVEAMEAAVAAVNGSTVANESNTNSLNENSEAQEVNAAAAFNRSEAFGTARISAGLLGNSLTGVEYGLARIGAASKILGPLLSAAMPIAIFAAGVDMVVRFGEAMYTAFDIGGRGAYKLQDNLNDLGLDLDKIEDKLELSILKQQEAQAKLEKKPFQNGLALALAEASEKADELWGKLDAAEKKKLELLRMPLDKGGLAPTGTQEFFGQKGLHDEEIMENEHNKWMRRASSLEDQKKESDRYIAVLAEHRKSVAQLSQAGGEGGDPISKAVATASGKPLSGPFTPKYDDKLAAIDEMMATEKKANAIIQKQMELNSELPKTESLKAAHTGGDPNQKRLQEIRAEFAEYQNTIVNTEGSFKPGQGASFWAAYLTEFKQGTNQAREVMTEYTRFVEENHKKLQSADNKLLNAEKHDNDRGVEEGMRAMDEWMRRTAEDAMHSGERWARYNEELERNVQIQNDNKNEAEQATLQQERALGVITQLAEDERLAALHTKEYTQRLKELRAELKVLQDAGAGMHPGDPNYEKNRTQQAGKRNEIDAMSGKQISAQITDHGKITQDIAAPFERAFTKIEGSFGKAVSSIRDGTQSVSRAFGKMGVEIVENVEDAAMKMVLQWAAQEAKMLLIHLLTNKIKVASDAEASAESQAISKTGAIKEIFVDAKQAAAGAYKAMAGIPIIGPELGAVAAAVTFAAVMGLAAFDVGGVIPGTGAVPILGHGGERVLTTGQTATFERMVNTMDNSSTSNTQKSNITYSPTVHAYDARGMRGMLHAHAEDLLDIIQNGINSGALTPP